MRRGLDLSFAKECQTKVARRVKDTQVDWAEEAQRRESIRVLEEHRFFAKDYVERMTNRLCAFSTARVCSLLMILQPSSRTGYMLLLMRTGCGETLSQIPSVVSSADLNLRSSGRMHVTQLTVSNVSAWRQPVGKSG